MADALARELTSLAREQEGPASVFHGAWPASVRRGGRTWFDRNAFVTALIAEALEPLAARPDVGTMLTAARAFLRRCADPTVRGTFAFWNARDPDFAAGADLDDTALVRGVLRADEPAYSDAREALRIFGPYRVTRGTELAAPSRWAQAFPGAFTTWMRDGRQVVDLAVNANVVAYLRSIDADIAGLARAESALCALLGSDAELQNFSPYYRSNALVLWRCARAARMSASLRLAVRRRLAWEIARLPFEPGEAPLWLAACNAADIDPPSTLRARPQSKPPELPVCTSLTGRVVWSSRALSTALALVQFAPTQGDQRA